MELIDKYNRKHDYLRISLTDRCNFNCIYCNPKNHILHSHKKINLLTFEELERLIKLFAEKLGFKKIRFTGGEPLIRKELFDFFERVYRLKKYYGLKLGITTNGSLLNGKTNKLKQLGFDNVNISLDSLDKNNFKLITGKDGLDSVLNSIKESEQAGFKKVKVNVVVIKGINDNEIIDFVDYFKDRDVNLRFIEFMPFGSNDWQRNGFVNYREIKSIVESKNELLHLKNKKNAVAKDYQIVNHLGKVSFISSISESFCSSCNRVRISADGTFRVCLFSQGEKVINFKELFRRKIADAEIVELLEKAILLKWEKHPEPEKLVNTIENNMMTIGG